MKCLAVIPAKTYSERLPNKNWRQFLGTNLVNMAYKIAESAYSITDTSTSVDRFNLTIESDFGNVLQRRSECQDIAAVAKDALEQHIDGQSYDYIVTLQPTCPARTPEMVDLLVQKVHEMGCNGGVTVTPIVPWQWHPDDGICSNVGPEGYRPSQEFADRYQEINAIQVASVKSVMEGKRWDWPMCLMVLPPYAAIDIDHPQDMRQASRILPAVLDALDREHFEFIKVEKGDA